MAVASTTTATVTSAAWILLADGDAGVTDALVQISTHGVILLRLAASLPGAEVAGGISVNDPNVTFSATLIAGQKLYGRAVSRPVMVAVMAGGA